MEEGLKERDNVSRPTLNENVSDDRECRREDRLSGSTGPHD